MVVIAPIEPVKDVLSSIEVDYIESVEVVGDHVLLVDYDREVLGKFPIKNQGQFRQIKPTLNAWSFVNESLARIDGNEFVNLDINESYILVFRVETLENSNE